MAYENASQKLGYEGKNTNEISSDLTERKKKTEIHQLG